MELRSSSKSPIAVLPLSGKRSPPVCSGLFTSMIIMIRDRSRRCVVCCTESTTVTTRPVFAECPWLLRVAYSKQTRGQSVSKEQKKPYRLSNSTEKYNISITHRFSLPLCTKLVWIHREKKSLNTKFSKN